MANRYTRLLALLLTAFFVLGIYGYAGAGRAPVTTLTQEQIQQIVDARINELVPPMIDEAVSAINAPTEPDPVIEPEPTPEPTPEPEPTPVYDANVKDYGAKGDGVSDDTLSINKAISSVSNGTVYIPAGTYLVNPDISIKLKSNVNLLLADNATLKAQSSARGEYAIIKGFDISNSGVIGGTIIGERYIHQGTAGEWGMGIGLWGCNNIVIDKVNIKDCWGDGIYIGSGTQNFCQGVTVSNFNIDNCRRQGISVISAKDLTVKDGLISNINGTAPQDGIDIEPNNNTEWMQNLLFQNVQTFNNKGFGIALTFWFYGGSVNPVYVVFDNCIDSGSLRNIDFGVGVNPFVEKYVETANCKVIIK